MSRNSIEKGDNRRRFEALINSPCWSFSSNCNHFWAFFNSSTIYRFAATLRGSNSKLKGTFEERRSFYDWTAVARWTQGLVRGRLSVEWSPLNSPERVLSMISLEYVTSVEYTQMLIYCFSCETQTVRQFHWREWKFLFSKWVHSFHRPSSPSHSIQIVHSLLQMHFRSVWPLGWVERAEFNLCKTAPSAKSQVVSWQKNY